MEVNHTITTTKEAKNEFSDMVHKGLIKTLIEVPEELYKSCHNNTSILEDFYVNEAGIKRDTIDLECFEKETYFFRTPIYNTQYKDEYHFESYSKDFLEKLSQKIGRIKYCIYAFYNDNNIVKIKYVFENGKQKYCARIETFGSYEETLKLEVPNITNIDESITKFRNTLEKLRLQDLPF